MPLIEGVQPLQRAMDIDRSIPARLSKQTDQPLGLAQGIGADQVRALGELERRGHQLGRLLAGRRMAEHRQGEGRLGDEDLAGLGLEGGAGRIGPALVVAGDDDGQPLPGDRRLGRAQHMAGRRQPHIDPVAAHRLAIGHRLHRPGEVRAIAFGHDVQRRGRGDDRAVPGARVIGVAMGDHRPRDRLGGVDIEVPRRAVETLGPWMQQAFRLDQGGRPLGVWRRFSYPA